MTDAPDGLRARTEAALEWLKSFTDYEQKLHAVGRSTFELGRMRRWCARLGHPERAPATIHVTGTKGKSSVTCLSEALLRAAGLPTYRFLSPHLEHLRERVALDGEPVDEATFVEALESLRPAVEGVRAVEASESPTFFETMTLLGWHLARRAGARADVVEVGLGGRLDATNVVTPTVSVITSIALDHTRLLGDTREAIAAEKAGIIKPGRPVVLGLTAGDPARRVIEDIAAAREAPVLTPEEHARVISWRPAHDPEQGPRVAFRGEVLGEALDEVVIRGHGRHTCQNALLAAAAVWLTLDRFPSVNLKPHKISGLIASLADRDLIPGRSEWWTGPPHILLDAAHTRESVAALSAILPDLNVGQGRTRAIVGLTRDRDPDAVLGSLWACVDDVVAAPLDSPRSANPADLAASAQRHGRPCRVAKDAREALDLALDRHDPASLVVVCGSIYLGGAIRIALRGRGYRLREAGKDTGPPPT